MALGMGINLPSLGPPSLLPMGSLMPMDPGYTEKNIILFLFLLCYYYDYYDYDYCN